MSQTEAGQATGEAGSVSRTGHVEPAPDFRTAHLQVFSRTLTGIAHDLQNHLAAINESAGWMGDLLNFRNKQRFAWITRLFKRGDHHRLDIEPYSKALDTIQEEVVQGSTSIQRLGDFGDRLEGSQPVFSGNKALDEIRDALLRRAVEKGVHLEMALADEAPMIESDWPGFQLAVFSVVEQVMGSLENGDRLVLKASVKDGQFEVRLTSISREELPHEPTGEPDGADFLRAIIEGLGGRILKEPGKGNQITTLAFPLAGAGT